MIALDVAVAVGLYALLRHVNRPLALAATAFRLIQAAILGANLMNMAGALQWATGGATIGATGPAATQGLTLASMELHSLVYDLGLVFFGIACLVLGHLLTVSRLVPRLLARGLTATGVVYLVGTTAIVLAPDVATTLDPMYGIAVVAELAIAGWLAVKGVAPTTTGRTPASPRRPTSRAAGTSPAAGQHRGKSPCAPSSSTATARPTRSSSATSTAPPPPATTCWSGSTPPVSTAARGTHDGLPYPTRLAFGLRRPSTPVPGMDLAGVVDAVGPDVTRFAPGDAVFGTAAAPSPSTRWPPRQAGPQAPPAHLRTGRVVPA